MLTMWHLPPSLCLCLSLSLSLSLSLPLPLPLSLSLPPSLPPSLSPSLSLSTDDEPLGVQVEEVGRHAQQQDDEQDLCVRVRARVRDGGDYHVERKLGPPLALPLARRGLSPGQDSLLGHVQSESESVSESESERERQREREREREGEGEREREREREPPG